MSFFNPTTERIVKDIFTTKEIHDLSTEDISVFDIILMAFVRGQREKLRHSIFISSDADLAFFGTYDYAIMFDHTAFPEGVNYILCVDDTRVAIDFGGLLVMMPSDSSIPSLPKCAGDGIADTKLDELDRFKQLWRTKDSDGLIASLGSKLRSFPGSDTVGAAVSADPVAVADTFNQYGIIHPEDDTEEEEDPDATGGGSGLTPS